MFEIFKFRIYYSVCSVRKERFELLKGVFSFASDLIPKHKDDLIKMAEELSYDSLTKFYAKINLWVKSAVLEEDKIEVLEEDKIEEDKIGLTDNSFACKLKGFILVE